MANNTEVMQIFNKVFKGQKNILTPTVIEYGVINEKYVYELSCGDGLTGGKMYGVTVVDRINMVRSEGVHLGGLSLGGVNEEQARQYIQVLKNKTLE